MAEGSETTATTTGDQSTESTAAQTTETAAQTTAQTQTTEQTSILAGARTETASTETQEAAAPQYKDGFQVDAEGKQVLDAEGKPIPQPVQTKAPAEYADFTMPKGTSLDEASATEFKSIAKELDLTQEQAQKLMSFGGDKIKALTEAPYKAWSEMQTKWQAEVKADPEIGGTKFQDSVKAVSLVFQPGESNPFVTNDADAKALREALNMTGAGNNPALVKLFVRMGNLLKEPGNLTGGPVNKSKDFLNAMYPKMQEAGSE